MQIRCVKRDCCCDVEAGVILECYDYDENYYYVHHERLTKACKGCFEVIE